MLTITEIYIRNLHVANTKSGQTVDEAEKEKRVKLRTKERERERERECEREKKEDRNNTLLPVFYLYNAHIAWGNF